MMCLLGGNGVIMLNGWRFFSIVSSCSVILSFCAFSGMCVITLFLFFSLFLNASLLIVDCFLLIARFP